MANNLVPKWKPLRGIATHYSPLTIHYLRYSLLTIHYPPSPIHYSLLTIHYYAKQTQFLKMQNEHKSCHNNGL